MYSMSVSKKNQTKVALFEKNTVQKSLKKL